MNVYALFVRPNKEIEQKALFVWLTRANAAMNGLTGEWQASTHQLVERLHAEVGDIEGGCRLPYSRCPLVTCSHDRQVQWRSRILCLKHLNMPDGLLPQRQTQMCCVQPPMPPPCMSLRTIHSRSWLGTTTRQADELSCALRRHHSCNHSQHRVRRRRRLPPPPQWQASLRQCSG